MRYHVEYGVDVNYQHPEFLTTPLIASIERGQHLITEYLLKHGADPHLRAGFSTDTAFVVARKLKNVQALALLQPYRKSLWTRIRELLA